LTSQAIRDNFTHVKYLMGVFMLNASLRRSGGSLILTIPQSYVEQNNLHAGSKLALEITGTELKLKPTSTRKTLDELLNATPEGLHRIENWDELPATGTEI
jgi:antitoxin ChpS